MKRWLTRLAGGYAGLGTLAYVLYRLRYVLTSDLRHWTESRSHEVTRSLSELRDGLVALRAEAGGAAPAVPVPLASPVRASLRQPGSPAGGRLRAAGGPGAIGAVRAGNHDRRPRAGTPVDVTVAA